MLAQTLVLDVRCQLALGRKPLHQQLRSQAATSKRRLLISSRQNKRSARGRTNRICGNNICTQYARPTYSTPHARTHTQHTSLYPPPTSNRLVSTPLPHTQQTRLYLPPTSNTLVSTPLPYTQHTRLYPPPHPATPNTLDSTLLHTQPHPTH